MKILLTGSSGFIGQNILEALGNRYEISAPSHQEFDLLNQTTVENYLSNGKFDIVIHSANTNHMKHPEVIGKVIEQDLRMYYNLANCSELYRRMIYFGSGAEYNINHYKPLMKEEYLGKYIPLDEYGFAKYVSACYTEKTRNIYELCLFGVYGKYEEWKRRFISNVIYQCMSFSEITINQHAMYDYLYIDDLISILCWFIDLSNCPRWHRYNVCTSKRKDLYEIAMIVKEGIHPDTNIRVIQEGWKKEYSGCNDRLLGEIGAFEFKDIRDAVKDLVMFYQDNGFV